MNYIDLLNSFWSIQGDYPLDNHSRALYFYLANVWNECRRPSVFKRRNDVIERDLKITRNTLNKARNILLESDFISFETYNGIANVDYTLSKYDEVSGKPIKSSSNFDEVGEIEEQTLSEFDKVEEKAHQNMTRSEETLSNNDKVLTESSSNFDKVEPTLSQTLSKYDNHKQRETENTNTSKEKDKKKVPKEPYQNLTGSLIPTKIEVIDLFMSLKELKPSEAESLAESFFSHWTAQNWRDGKSLIFDWAESAKNWKRETSDFKAELKSEPVNESAKEEKSRKSKAISKEKRFTPPSVDEVKAYCEERANSIDAQHFVDHYTANGWMRGKTKLKDWKACVRTWERNNFNNKANNSENGGITESLAKSVAEGIARANYQG